MRNSRIMKLLFVLLIISALIMIGIIIRERTDIQSAEEDQSITSTEMNNNTVPVNESELQVETEIELEAEVEVQQTIKVQNVSAQRMDALNIQITWSDDLDSTANKYRIEKADTQQSADLKWQLVEEVVSDGVVSGEPNIATDHLLSEEPQQYFYRVVPVTEDSKKYASIESDPAVCTNVLICIDPGHYAGKNAANAVDSYGYAEGDFTLKIAQKLSDILQNEYGISSCMTRTSGTIDLHGYTNKTLDSGHISLRGTYAGETESTLFVSIHTNANEDYANNVGTFEQPIAINKPIIIANDLAISSDKMLLVCNAIGKNLAKTSFDAGIYSYQEFETVSKGEVREWTVDYNDSTSELGSVVCRHGDDGQFYGVLRGAQEAGIPGIIIEHGYHTVKEMRYAAMYQTLDTEWAEADARGIAEGFGFSK